MFERVCLKLQIKCKSLVQILQKDRPFVSVNVKHETTRYCIRKLFKREHVRALHSKLMLAERKVQFLKDVVYTNAMGRALTEKIFSPLTLKFL
jgi:hypothetical protein